MYSAGVIGHAMAPNSPPVPNSWEVAAIQVRALPSGIPFVLSALFSSGAAAESSQVAADYSQQDPLIYPGLYSASGFNMLDILFRVTARPNPQVELGPVDASCAMVLCDLTQPDSPIVYVSEPFEELTGYSADEVIGRNCRFLQAPPGRSLLKQGSTRRHVPKDLVKRMRKAVDRDAELQLEVPNFRKDGTPFTNILTIIPISWDDSVHYHYSVGFLSEKE
ncbi:cellulose signaling associated protein ENVOY [Magnaporthiopsis poae ATCC 64411]|uniref:Cellulose signaling associated protein ENVOY n=1 Tax=Magnaporthiopsis poae (strain ATCC 64411 / 73-15) TaxID=644358 RepID=A0A0C4E0I7_MAGP6|nr:cellulose signaling associated protein ENVOY [Magnaporthiopsis poae ATCC 64411]